MKDFKFWSRLGGLRKRWLLNTASVVFALGLVCVMAVTASFAAYYYSNMESDMYNRARSTTDFFADYVNQNYNAFYQTCITYAQTFEDKGFIELQFISEDGTLVASSYGPWAGESPATPEIHDAVSSRTPIPYVGKDPSTGERIMAVSSPMIYSNGQVVGESRSGFWESQHHYDTDGKKFGVSKPGFWGSTDTKLENKK